MPGQRWNFPENAEDPRTTFPARDIREIPTPPVRLRSLR